jgi:hypothetical protein
MNPAGDFPQKRRPGYSVPGLKPKARDEEQVPKASPLGTMIFLLGLFLTMVNLTGDSASKIAAFAARGVALSLAASILVDLRNGLRNLVRPDVMALCSLFFLTLFEFLLPQSNLDQMLSPKSLSAGCEACMWGFAGIAIGRHVMVMGNRHFTEMFAYPVSPAFIIRIFWSCFVIGYFYMLMSVNFNPIEMVSQFLDARFSQSWTRGRFGSWSVLLGEFALLIYVLPAIAGVVLARPERYTKSQVMQVILVFAFTIFYGFTSGTRNVFACYLVTFLIGYAFSLKREETKRLIAVTACVAVALLVATRVMLEFRTVGLRYYISSFKEIQAERDTGTDDSKFFVDYNLFVICQMTEVFPERYHYLGWEVPYQSLIRPIPRALWPQKPEGLSISFEEVLGVEGLTLASSFVGESYISYGFVGVFLTGMFFGIVFGWWGMLASPRNSDFGVLVYASGFFAAVISMRSMFVFTTAILPTIAALVAGQYMMRQGKARPGGGLPQTGGRP